MATVTKPIALDESLHTTEQTPRNLADVLAQALQMLNTTISGLNFINCVVVQTLPTTDISTTTIYLVPKNPSQTDNLYDEYINLTGTSAGWEKIGDTEIDLSNYYTKAETDTLLSAKADTSDIPTVNDGALTIQQNGETKGTFTANQSGNSTVNIETPTTDIQTAVDEFETYNGGLLSECKVTLVPVQSGSGDPSPDNVRPISGHTQVVVGDDGKNKLPNTVASITKDGVTFTVHSDGTVMLNGTSTNVTSVAYEIIALNGKYILNGCPSGGGSGTYELQAVTTITSRDYGDGVTFTVNGDCLVQILVRQGVTLNNVVFKPMIRLASDTDPTYVPYNGYQITVNLGGTYYSGVLDVVSGVLTVDREIIVIDNATNISGYTTSTSGSFGKITVTNLLLNTSKIVVQSEVAISVKFTDRVQTEYINKYRVYGDDVQNQIVLRASVSDNITTAEDLKAKFINSKIIFELATPQTIQLTPQQVKALVGENHLSAQLDGQEITESKYKQMFTFDDVIAYIQSLS